MVTGWHTFRLHADRDGNLQVYVMDVGDGEQIRLTGSLFDYAPCWSSDGTLLAFTSNHNGDDDIYVMNADSSGVALLIGNPANNRNPSLSPR